VTAGAPFQQECVPLRVAVVARTLRRSVVGGCPKMTTPRFAAINLDGGGGKDGGE
jgi:hypothetical protein